MKYIGLLFVAATLASCTTTAQKQKGVEQKVSITVPWIPYAE